MTIRVTMSEALGGLWYCLLSSDYYYGNSEEKLIRDMHLWLISIQIVNEVMGAKEILFFPG